MTTIFVAKLDFGVTEDELLSVFKQYGHVNKVNIAKDKETGKPRGFAFVEMSDDTEAKQAIREMDGYAFNGRKCVVKEAEDRGGGRDQSSSRPRSDFQRGDSKPFSRPQHSGNRPEQKERFSDEPPMPPVSDDDAPAPFNPLTTGKPAPVKKKKTGTRTGEADSTNDGKSKKPKMNAYKKSGKDNVFFDDDDELDEDFDLFGRDEEEDDLDDAYSKYVVNSDDDDEEWEDDEWEDDEEWEDDDDQH